MTDNALTTGDFTEENEPFALFASWLADAEKSEINDPNAVALATVDADGLPNVRMVLLKGFDRDGFVFYTNFESQKGQEILGQKKAAMCFHWKSLRRQVRLRGPDVPCNAKQRVHSGLPSLLSRAAGRTGPIVAELS